MLPETLAVFQAFASARPDSHFLAVTTNAAVMNEACSRAGILASQRSIVSVPHTEVPAYVAAADVGLLFRDASIINRVASPVKFAEYLACGVPVVLTDGIGDYSERVRQAKIGLVLQRGSDITETARSIESFLRDYGSDPEGWRARCAAIASAELSMDRWGTLIRSVYSRLMPTANEAQRAACRLRHSEE
jgi:glycosyltransferase involved in cell wall biosynthesis